MSVFARLFARFQRDVEARAIKRQIAEARAKHQSTRHLCARLTALRHRQLAGCRR